MFAKEIMKLPTTNVKQWVKVSQECYQSFS